MKNFIPKKLIEFFPFFLTLSLTFSYANNKIDSLNLLLNKSKSDTAKLRILESIFLEYKNSNPEKALERRNIVLSQMEKYNFLSTASYQKIVKKNSTFKNNLI